VVRITERQPVAFVNLPLRFGQGSRVLLIDADGILLDPPPQARFSFPILSGVSEDQSEPARRKRVRAMLSLLADLGPLGRNVSEVNAASPEDLHVITQLDGRGVELALGDGNYGPRMQNFLNHYPEIRKRLGNATSFDLRLDDRITAKE
jgi:cell division protein FtsQ